LIATKHWLAAHLWFGLAAWPIAVLHSGFHLGGALPATLMIVFTLTILSGIYGWVLQNIIPRMLLKQVTAETIYSQIDVVSRRNVADAYSLLTGVFGPPPSELAAAATRAATTKASASRGDATPAVARDERMAPDTDTISEEIEYLPKRKLAVVVGAVRDVGRVRGRTLRTATFPADPQNADEIWSAYYRIEGFLLDGRRADAAFSNPAHASAYFANLRRACDPACAEVINSLEDYCDQRRQFDLQTRLHHWLHGWLPVHIGLAVAVSVLLIVHVITALRYW
jgi:hypothetical protein